MTDVLLINANTWEGKPPSYLPAGVISIAALIRQHGYSVKIIDRNVDMSDPTALLLKERPKVVGFSVLSGPVILDALDLSGLVKKTLKDAKVVWGGLHPTIFPNYVLENDKIDYIVKGEGEYAFLDLLNFLLKGQGDLETMENIGYVSNGKIKLNPNRPFCEYDQLPFPAWDLLGDPKQYIMKKFYSNNVVTLYTSRGCPWRCAFCYIQSTKQRKFRPLTAEQIVAQMEYFEKNWGVDGFQFYDDEFDVLEKRVMDMCQILIDKKKKYKFSHFSRVDHINLNRLLFEKKAGLSFIEFGVESGSNRMLKFMQKDTDVERIKFAFDICRKAKVRAGAMFMVGLPTETAQEVRETRDLIESLNAHQAIGTIYKPYPATPLFDYCVKEGLFKMPPTLKEQGEIFGLGEFSLNMSNVPMGLLKQVYNQFYLKNIKNEVINCFLFFNFKLLFYYFRKKFLPNIPALARRQFVMLFSGNKLVKYAQVHNRDKS